MVRLNIDSALRVLATRQTPAEVLGELLAIKAAQEVHQNVDLITFDYLDHLLILGYRFTTERTHQHGVTYLCLQPSSNT